MAFLRLLLGALLLSSPLARAASKARLDAVLNGMRRQAFRVEDGLTLNFTTFEDEAQPKVTRPIVISPGKGETAFRYVELAERLMSLGYGPIYVLDHRGQGFSERQVEGDSLVHVDTFDHYVEDFVAFVRGPVMRDLAARGFIGKPMVIAHSMGGAIVNRALLREPGLVARTVYIAPMMDINVPGLNAFRDRVAWWTAALLCRLGFCKNVGLGARAPRSIQPYPNAPALERAHGIYADPVTPNWLKHAIKTTWEIQESASEHAEPALIIVAEKDTCVQNQAIREYACAAQNCELKSIDGKHSLHREGRRVKAELVSYIHEFLSPNCGEFVEGHEASVR